MLSSFLNIFFRKFVNWERKGNLKSNTSSTTVNDGRRDQQDTASMDPSWDMIQMCFSLTHLLLY